MLKKRKKLKIDCLAHKIEVHIAKIWGLSL